MANFWHDSLKDSMASLFSETGESSRQKLQPLKASENGRKDREKWEAPS